MIVLGIDPGLSGALAFYDTVRRFARDVIRPAGRQLDRMSAAQASRATLAPEKFPGMSDDELLAALAA